MFLRKLGFTMIELLIVIAVLGILAVAVLAAINPIEQINRGKDTGTRSDAEQLLSAVDRYYAGRGYYPWMADNESENLAAAWVELQGTATTTIAVGADGEDMLANLSSGGTSEVKESFITRIINAEQTTPLRIFNEGSLSSDSTYICFTPKSASFREEAWKRCSDDGVARALPGDFPPLACPAGGTCATAATSDLATACFICL